MGLQYKLYCMIIKKKQKIRTCMVNQNVYWYKEAYIHYAWKYQYQTISNLAWEEKQIDIYLCLYQNKYYVKLFISFNRKGGTFFF